MKMNYRINRIQLAVLPLLICVTNIGFSQSITSEWIAPIKPVKSTPVKAAPANDDCSSANTLTIDAGLDLTGTTFDATLQVGECYTNYGGGASEHTVWYRFNANNDSLVFAINKTNYTNCVSPHVRIYGPVAVGGGCLPTCGTEIYNLLHNGDPGQHTLLTSLTVGLDYLIQVQDLDCGGPNDGHVEFAIGIFSPPTNNIASGADGIDECGVVYNGTNTGYTPEDLVPGNDNLDGNAGTTCPSCVTAGDDVPYVVNNSSWFTFCATTTGTWNIDFSGIANCVNAAPNYGLQMTIFRGTSTNLTVVEHAPSPSNPGSSWTSADFAVAAGECIFLVVDGFAGDQCDYSYTLNNVTGGCNLLSLPIELLDFTAEINDHNSVDIFWSTASETNNKTYTIERSQDGENYSLLNQTNGAGTSSGVHNYRTLDQYPFKGTSYYKLSQTDYNGETRVCGITAVNNSNSIQELAIDPNPVTSSSRISFNSAYTGTLHLQIFDLSGRKMSDQSIEVAKGANRKLINTENIPSGMYFVVLTAGGNSEYVKFVKR